MNVPRFVYHTNLGTSLCWFDLGAAALSRFADRVPLHPHYQQSADAENEENALYHGKPEVVCIQLPVMEGEEAIGQNSHHEQAPFIGQCQYDCRDNQPLSSQKKINQHHKSPP